MSTEKGWASRLQRRRPTLANAAAAREKRRERALERLHSAATAEGKRRRMLIARLPDVLPVRRRRA